MAPSRVGSSSPWMSGRPGSRGRPFTSRVVFAPRGRGVPGPQVPRSYRNSQSALPSPGRVVRLEDVLEGGVPELLPGGRGDRSPGRRTPTKGPHPRVHLLLCTFGGRKKSCRRREGRPRRDRGPTPPDRKEEGRSGSAERGETTESRGWAGVSVEATQPSPPCLRRQTDLAPGQSEMTTGAEGESGGPGLLGCGRTVGVRGCTPDPSRRGRFRSRDA